MDLMDLEVDRMMREFPQRSEEKQTCESVPRNQDGGADNKDQQEQQSQSVYREQSTMKRVRGVQQINPTTVTGTTTGTTTGT